MKADLYNQVNNDLLMQHLTGDLKRDKGGAHRREGDEGYPPGGYRRCHTQAGLEVTKKQQAEDEKARQC